MHEDGLPSLDAAQLRALRRLDEILLQTAESRGAHEVGYAPLNPLSALARIDYLQNFPHLGLAVAPLQTGAAARLAAGAVDATSISGDDLLPPRYFLPSAACYPVYAQLRDRRLDSRHCVTTVQRCFRNETHYEGLARLLAFTMREVVVVGKAAEVRDYLSSYKAWLLDFAKALGLDVAVQQATDPFFEPDGQRALMQQLFPVKEEFVFEGRVAIASVNFHRNFFGQRWNIRAADGEHAFTGCIAFGLERCLHALECHWGKSPVPILAALDRAANPSSS